MAPAAEIEELQAVGLRNPCAKLPRVCVQIQEIVLSGQSDYPGALNPSALIRVQLP